MPYSDIDDIKDADVLAETYHETAADLVQRYAPTPDPLPAPDPYSPRAARAEILITNWLTQTKGGVLSSKSLGAGGYSSSKGFTSGGLAVVRGIIRDSMGVYYAGSGSNKGYISTLR